MKKRQSKQQIVVSVINQKSKVRQQARGSLTWLLQSARQNFSKQMRLKLKKNRLASYRPKVTITTWKHTLNPIRNQAVRVKVTSMLEVDTHKEMHRHVWHSITKNSMKKLPKLMTNIQHWFLSLHNLILCKNVLFKISNRLRINSMKTLQTSSHRQCWFNLRSIPSNKMNHRISLTSNLQFISKIIVESTKMAHKLTYHNQTWTWWPRLMYLDPTSIRDTLSVISQIRPKLTQTPSQILSQAIAQLRWIKLSV